MGKKIEWSLHLWQPDGAEVNIPMSIQENHYRMRSLLCLVNSCADSFLFVRKNDTITYIPEAYKDTTWQVEVGRIIENHFQFELSLYMPQGEWRVGVVPYE
jgi:hypothetical protein